MDARSDWCWSKINGAKLLEVVQRLGAFEKMTWTEIERGGSHQVEKHRLCKAARDRLLTIQQDDVDELFSLRLTGTNRIWGIRVEGTLRILWWDPEHKVCPSPKKHT